MAGVTGRQVTSAFGRSTSWGVPASVTQQLLYQSTEGLDNQIAIIDDEAFTQQFLGVGEPGDVRPVTADLAMQLRFEQGCPTFIAHAMGSAAAPVGISSQGASNSLVGFKQRELQAALEAAGQKVHLIGGADVAAELDAKRAINQGSRLAAGL